MFKMIPQKIVTECHWEITKHCNLSCIHCITATDGYGMLNTKDALKAVDNLYNLNCKQLYITGGEPLVRKDIFDILQYAKEKGFKIRLLTNGILINAKSIKKIKLFIDELGISLDGSSAMINDSIRGKGSYKRIIKSISIIKKYSIPFSLYVTINRLNLDDLWNILRFSKSLGAKGLRLNEITLRGRALKNKKELCLTESSKNSLNDLLIKYAGQDKKDIVVNDKCDINPQTIFLSPEGFIYTCSEIFQNKPNHFLGNILDATPKSLFTYKNFYLKKKKGCPYQLLVGKNITACLNNTLIKCQFVYAYSQ